jgi:predicted glycogen debranching enzyme
MSYIKFDKTQLINLAYSLDKEVVRSNKSGAYASNTIIDCNTRKFHGLLIAPQPNLPGLHVLISSLDAAIVQNDTVFNLGIHKFPEKYHPKGHKYFEDFTVDPIPKLTYRVGGVLLTKEKLLVEHESRTLVRYTLEEAPSPVILRLSPFLAFRNVHALNKANDRINKNFEKINQGIKLRLYEEYAELYMQLSKETNFVAASDWYYNVEYPVDQERGEAYQEDLYTPGYFEVEFKKGESIIFTGGMEETKTANLLRMFNTQTRRRTARNSYENCLKEAARQFVLKTYGPDRKQNRTDVVVSYHWNGKGGRDTFIAIPGITMATGDIKSFRAVLDTMVKDQKGVFFPYWETAGAPVRYDSIDTQLWFFWALHKYHQQIGDKTFIWKNYGKVMVAILEAYRKGTDFHIKMQEDGLLYGGSPELALTWMDATIDGKPVTPRMGLAVEVNALWYNAICYTLAVAGPRSAEGKRFIRAWKHLPEKIEKAFVKTFWNEKYGYLADYVYGDYKDWSVRPNQILALSLPYSPLKDDFIKKSILETVQQELLTPRGLRSLSPKNAQYKGTFQGNSAERNSAYHQGSVWPWLLGHFAEACINLHGRDRLSFVKSLYTEFEEVMTDRGVSTISEVYDGDPPHKPGGAISQAWNVAEIIRMGKFIHEYDLATQPASV